MLKPKMRFLSSVACLVGLLTACAGAATPQAPASLTAVRLPMGYIPNVQYAPFYVADSKGFFKENDLEITFDYSPETDGVALVGAGELQFSVVSGEQVLLARAQNLPVVTFFAWWRNYPVAVASLKSQNILKPEDLKGKKIGLPGLYGANYIGLQALLAAGGLTEKDVQLESLGFNQVEALVSGRVDAVSIYANNEPIQLKLKGYEVDVVRVADYVQLASNGLLTNEKTIAEQPELVKRMARAVAAGVNYTLANPDEAFMLCTQYVEGLRSSDQTAQKEIFLASMEFWKPTAGQRMGESDPLAWENMQQVLLNMGLLKQPLDLQQAFTNAFIPTK
jgi:NitT/TauT family transport system substrate-binding protein